MGDTKFLTGTGPKGEGMVIGNLDEKPGGARNVVRWDVCVERDHRPVYLLTNQRAGYMQDEARSVVVRSASSSMTTPRC